MIKINNTSLRLFLCAVWMTSIVYSPFLLSMSMMGLVMLSFMSIEVKGGKLKIGFVQDLFQKIKTLPKHPPFWAGMCYFLVVLVSAWQTDAGNWDYWLERARIKLPFLILPLVFLAMPRITERQLNGLFYFLLIMMSITCVGIGINYLQNMEEIQLMINQGKSIPTPRNHIRFSLLLAVSIVGGTYIYFKGYFWKKNWERYVILGLTLFSFFFIHFLSVRTGLVALYFAIVLALIRYILISRRFVLGISALLLFASLPFIGYYTLPSFKTKINYMIWDIGKFQRGEGGIYADSGRLTSLQAGWGLFQRNPMVGVGAGNLRKEVAEVFENKYPSYVKSLTPHNQFIYTMAATGLLGLAIFLVAFLLPFFYNSNYTHPLFLSFYAILLVCFMLEHTIENSIGVGFVCFFLVLLFNYLMKNEE